MRMIKNFKIKYKNQVGDGHEHGHVRPVSEWNRVVE